MREDGAQVGYDVSYDVLRAHEQPSGLTPYSVLHAVNSPSTIQCMRRATWLSFSPCPSMRFPGRHTTSSHSTEDCWTTVGTQWLRLPCVLPGGVTSMGISDCRLFVRPPCSACLKSVGGGRERGWPKAGNHCCPVLRWSRFSPLVDANLRTTSAGAGPSLQIYGRPRSNRTLSSLPARQDDARDGTRADTGRHFAAGCMGRLARATFFFGRLRAACSSQHAPLNKQAQASTSKHKHKHRIPCDALRQVAGRPDVGRVFPAFCLCSAACRDTLYSYRARPL